MSVTKKSVVSYLIFSITLLMISAIYNHYSHNVTSIFMSYVFIIPLLGALLSLLSKKNTYHNLLGASILTLSSQSSFQQSLTATRKSLPLASPCPRLTVPCKRPADISSPWVSSICCVHLIRMTAPTSTWWWLHRSIRAKA